MLKQSDKIYRFATKFGLLAGILLCVEAVMTATSIFGALCFLLRVTYPWNYCCYCLLLLLLLILLKY